ncbi:MAG: phage tail protein [Sphingobacteriia bacterium]|nr:phage tail protein [Sphingobacteriia bacterium]
MSASVVVTRDGERLDALCWRHYRRLRGSVEAVLAANPGLAVYPPHLPGGVSILLPELPEPQPARLRLW